MTKISRKQNKKLFKKEIARSDMHNNNNKHRQEGDGQHKKTHQEISRQACNKKSN